jgi:predicted Zn-dependent peptidase
MESKIIKRDGYNIHLINTNKFKKIMLRVILRRPRKENDYLISALVDLMSLRTKLFKSKRERYIYEEDLYNIMFSAYVTRYGMETELVFGSSFIDPDIVGEDFLEDAIKYPFDLIHNPLFDESLLDDVKTGMIKRYNRLMEDYDYYVDVKAYDYFYDKDIYKSHLTCEPEITKTITMKQLEDTYHEVFNNSSIDIYVTGNIANKEEKIIEYLDKYNTFKSNCTLSDYRMYVGTRDKEQRIEEPKKGVNQTLLYMIYNIKDYDRVESMKAVLFNKMLGVGMNSKLFANVRELNKLCYAIDSSYIHINNSICIYVGLDYENVDKAINIIKDTINSMRNITDEELSIATSKALIGVKLSEDSLTSMFRKQCDIDLHDGLTDEQNINRLKTITKEEVQSVVDDIKLNTVYILKGEEHE